MKNCKYLSIWGKICLYNKNIKDQFLCDKRNCPLINNNNNKI